MEVSELRIGNFIRWDMNDPKQDDEPEQGYVDVRLDLWQLESPLRISPIPLTEEWLVKFGAIRYNNSPPYYLIVVPNNDFIGLDIRWIDDRFYLYAECDDGFYSKAIKKVEYVHTVQNLFFYLTDNELPVL